MQAQPIWITHALINTNSSINTRFESIIHKLYNFECLEVVGRVICAEE